MNLLAVDDQINVVNGLAESIAWKDIGIAQVFRAYSAAGAKEIFLKYPVDILLCDIEMPAESGFGLLEWVRAQGLQVECIFLTAHADFGYARTALQMDSFDYILKPARYSEIEAAVGRAIDKISRDRNLSRLARVGEEAEKRRYEEAEGGRGKGDALYAAAAAGYAAEKSAACPVPGGPAGKSGENRGTEGRLREDENPADTDLSPGEAWPEGFDEGAEDETRRRIAQVKRYIARNLDRELRRDEIAEHVFLNPSYLSRLFTKAEGISLKEYIIQEKMRAAREMIRTTGLSISIIAVRVGYASFSYFSQTYKQVYGISPSEERRTGRNTV